MNKRVEIFGLALLAAGVTTTTARATTWYSQAGSAEAWDDPFTWNTSRDGSGTAGGPTINDDVVIQSGHTVYIFQTTEAANTVLVESGTIVPGLLQILDGGVLKVKTSVTLDDTSAVQGAFWFSGALAETKLVADDGNNGNAVVVALTGIFELRSMGGTTEFTQLDTDGNDNDSFQLAAGSYILPLAVSEVTISAPFENDGSFGVAGDLTCTHAIQNDGEIDFDDGQFDASLNNNGTISATGDVIFIGPVINDDVISVNGGDFRVTVQNTGSISIDGDGIFLDVLTNDGELLVSGDTVFETGPDEDSTGLFKVSGSGSTMAFNIFGACNITGGADFEVGAGGHLIFNNDNLTTNGGIKIAGSSSFPGKVTAAAGITFEATGDF